MGHAVSRRLGQTQYTPKVLNVEALIELFRKLQIVVDSCVGVLHRNDFLNFDHDIDDTTLCDLSRFVYLSFATIREQPNELGPLEHFFFRSAILSVFGHIIVNAITYINRKDLKYPFLHVVTGTPGIGKSASRYPFITLLMSYGVRDITTKRNCECAFVFRRVNKAIAGSARITTKNSDGKSVTLKVPTYFYHYDVYAFYFNGGATKRDDSEDENKPESTTEATYDPAEFHNILNDPDKPCPVLGQLIVPSVEHFPRFLRLMTGNNTHDFDKATKTDYDITITARSFLKKGSVFATDSSLIIRGPHQNSVVFPGTAPLEADLRIEAGSTIKAGSTIGRESSLIYFSVQNKLENTGWHVIDDLKVSEKTFISQNDHCVLFTSPQGSRWNETNTSGKGRQCFIAEYVVPKFSLQEEAALLNTMGQARELRSDELATLKVGLQMFSFVPRLILEPGRTRGTLDSIAQAELKTDVSRSDLFGPKVSHKLLHFSCPQFDCHNWFVQFATNKARLFVLDMFNLESTKHYIHFLKTMTKNVEFNQKKAAIFHNFVLDAIACGFSISFPTRFLSNEPLNCEKLDLPIIMGESNIYLRSSSNIRRAFLPDISGIDKKKLFPFEQKYDILFKNPMLPRLMQSSQMDDRDGTKEPILATLVDHKCNASEPPAIPTVIPASESFPSTSGMATRHRKKMNTLTPPIVPTPGSVQSTSESFMPSKKKAKPTPKLSHDSPNSPSTTDDPNIKCFTYSLNPLGGNTAGFDSILLFFKVHEEQAELKIDALSVMFIQSTLASHHSISSAGSNLMFLCLALFANIYNLKQEVIFPFLFFVKSPFVDEFTLDGDNNSKFFMDPKNIWVINGYAAQRSPVDGSIHVEYNGSVVEYKGRLILDSVVSLLPNTNPNYFRCCFCHLVLKADFSNHRCKKLQSKEPIQSSEQLISSPWVAYASGMGKIGVYDRENPQVNFERKEGSRLLTKVLFTLVVEDEPNSTSGHSSTIDCGGYGINLNYNQKGLSPNSRDNHNRIDMIDIVLIKPKKDKDNEFPMIDVSPEPEPPDDSFEVTYDGPILDLFSYSVRRPVNAIFMDSVVEDMSVKADVLQKLKDNKDTIAEVDHPNSHLHESLELLRIWGAKKAIGFTKAGTSLHAYAGDTSQTPFDDVDRLCKNQSIPLSQMFVPMEYLNRLPVNLYNTRELIPFEIKCILTGASSTKRLRLEHLFTNEHIRYGIPMAQKDLEKVVGDTVVGTHLLTKWLIPLRSHRPSMMNMSLNDLSQLVSYVNGSYLIVADILQLCMKYLNREDQLTLSDLTSLTNYLDNAGLPNPENQVPPSEEAILRQQTFWKGIDFRVSQSLQYLSANSSSFIGSLDGKPTFVQPTLSALNNVTKEITLNKSSTYNAVDLLTKLTEMKKLIEIRLDFMKTCLGHGLNIVNKQLQLLVAQVIGKQPLPEFTNDDRAHLIDQYGTNPLLSPWHRLMLIPFFLDVSQNQERNNLIVKLKESSDSSLEQHEIDFLYAFLTIQAPLDDQETTNLRSVVENNFKDPSKTELINLIKGELPSGEGTFHRLPNTSEYKTKWCDTMNRLENNQHYNLDRAFLGYCLETQHPLKDSKKDRLISLIDNSTLPAKEKNTLHVLITGKPIYSQFRRETIVSYYLYLPFNHNSSLLDQIKNSPSLSEQKKAEKIELATTELARSDLEIATEFVRHPLKSAERDLNLLFKILKGEEHVSQRRRQQLITKIRHIQQSIIQTKKDMCVRLGKDGRLSWMDLASLLCSPNGDQSQYLVAIRSFDENNPLDTKGLDDVAIDGIYDNDLGIERTGTPPNRPTNQLGDSPYHEEPSTPLPFPHRSIVITPKNTIDKRSGSDDPENQ